MRQGVVAAAVLALVAGVAPAVAAPSPRTIVYEVVRTSPKAAAQGRVRIVAYAGSETVTVSANIAPDGAGYRTINRKLFATMGSDTYETEMDVDLASGRRFLAGGERGRFVVAPQTPGWTVREAGRGFRVVNVPSDDLHTAGPVQYEVSEGVRAPAGPYGSVAYGHLPCSAGAGTWTFTSDTEPWSGPPNVCSPADDTQYAETRRGRTWILDADVTAINGWPYKEFDVRIAVLDFPKLPR